MMIDPDADRHRASSLLTSVFVLLGASVALEITAQLLPPHYSPIRDSESALAVGPYGFVEAISLCLRGRLVFVLLRAAYLVIPTAQLSPVGLPLLRMGAAAKFVIAFVATDLTPRPTTIHGAVHAVVAFASFFAGSIGEVAFARRLKTSTLMAKGLLLRLAQLTVLWSIVTTATVGLRLGIWGLLERIETAMLLGWALLLALGLRQQTLPNMVADFARTRGTS